jgi:diguanylate cyclase (GGDEF)-like protein
LIKKEFPLKYLAIVEGTKKNKVHYSYPTKAPIPSLPLITELWNKAAPREGIIQKTPEEQRYFHPLNMGSKGHSYAALGLHLDEQALEESEWNILRLAISHLGLTAELTRSQKDLKAMATVDALTGAISRREFMRLTKVEIGRTLRNAQRGKDQSFSLVYLDLDNFKTVNETLGHKMGDQVLINFVKILRRVLRDLDTIGRIGGDEFLILLPDCPEDGAGKVCRRILDQINSGSLLGGIEAAQKIPQDKALGCSIGLTSYQGEEEISLETLIDQADQSLYQAKTGGKGNYKTASSQA